MEFEGAFFNTSDYIKTDKVIGEGSFGKVYLVKKVENDKPYAAKIIDSHHVFTGKSQMLLMRESSILHKLSHKAIVKFYGINFHSFDNPNFLEPTILTKYYSKGSLKEILTKDQHGLADADWNPTKKYICLLGVADAIRYLHSKGILHRDLKPENILIDENYYPKVCDFGFSRCFSENLSNSVQLTMTERIGTPLYMSPELLEGEGHYGPGIDAYAFAILAYEIVSGREPFSENGKSISFGNLIDKILSGERPKLTDEISNPMKDLLKRCWSKDIKERPSFDEIFKELSTNFEYISEDIDKEEITDYLLSLSKGIKKDIKQKEEEKKNVQEDSSYQIQNQINEKKGYLEIIKDLVAQDVSIDNTFLKSVGGNILFKACMLGDIDLVKYIISLNKIDIASKTILFYY